MLSKAILFWLLRKAIYTVGAAAITALVAYIKVGGGPGYDFSALTLTGAIGGLSAAVIGDLRRGLFPDFLQIVTGTDPRSDG